MDIQRMSDDAVGWLSNNAQATVDAVGGFAIAYPGVILAGAALSGAAVTYGYIQLWMKTRKPVDEVSEMKRRVELDQKYADAFGDSLFDMLMKDEITRHEYRRDCKRFGLAYRLSDLLVKKNPKRGLRYRVVKNCEDMHRSPPPKLPPELPHVPAPAVVVVVKRKAWIATGKAALRLKSAS